ncbi:MAG: hypothetical protein H7X91_09850 [Burkholderiales bacterium]|nr:hypothetical protein [Burkholderiales bacterium]
MSKLLSRMLAVLFTASLSFGAVAESNQSASDSTKGKQAQAEPTNPRAKDNVTGEPGSDYKQQRGVTDGRPMAGPSGSDATPTRDRDASSGKGKSDYGMQRGVTDGASSPTSAEVQTEYKAAVANCSNQSGEAKTNCMKKAAKERDKMMSSIKTGTKDEAGVSGRAGTGVGAGTGNTNNDSAPIGEKPSDPTSQGSSAGGHVNENAGGSSGSTRK